MSNLKKTLKTASSNSIFSRGVSLGAKVLIVFLTVFKMLTGMITSLVTLFLHLLLESSVEIVLNDLKTHYTSSRTIRL